MTPERLDDFFCFGNEAVDDCGGGFFAGDEPDSLTAQ
jgi:hypothetical protein